MGKIVVVTGAGAGVGRAVATEFARSGCDLALLSRDPARLERAAEELRGLGVRALAIPTDVADAGAVERAADRVERDLGPIDTWVNVAMATVFAPVSTLTPEEVERGTAVTYLGQVHGILAALRRMRPRNRGTIVCVGSALAYRAIPLQSVYCAAKFAVRGFTEALRQEMVLNREPVKVTTVHPGGIKTAIAR
ncbi:MAG: SDR family NAD(P)-dependent oxidoreductase, partial [Acetobacteraceae bacterium]|nr:SDR family NAD(P)-dependent oxidoreductase [Acetobacteraceae bacterium]